MRIDPPKVTKDRLNEVADKLLDVDTVKEAADLLALTGKAIGLPWAAPIADVTNPEHEAQADFRSIYDHLGWPDWMIEKWSSRSFPRQFPIYLSCRFENSLFSADWGSMWDDLEPLSSAQRQMKADLEAIGINACVAVPVHLSLGRTAAVVWSSDNKKTDVRTVVASYAGQLQTIAFRFISILRPDRLAVSEMRELPHLTARQIECLLWLARGKTIADTAAILGISVHTIRDHLRDIVHRMNVTNTTHAIAIACELGIVKPMLKQPKVNEEPR